jgi:flagellar motor switch protein FliN
MTSNIVNRIELPALLGRNDEGAVELGQRLDLVGHLPVRLSVALGSAEITIDRLFSLSANDVIPLDSEIDAPVDVRLNGKVIARGTLVAVGDNFGVRITELSLET